MDPLTTLASGTVAALLLLTLGYGLACWIWPFKLCRRCAGTGRRRSPTRRALRLCRRCHGTGLRLRAGRWIANHLNRIRKEAHR